MLNKLRDQIKGCSDNDPALTLVDLPGLLKGINLSDRHLGTLRQSVKALRNQATRRMTDDGGVRRSDHSSHAGGRSEPVQRAPLGCHSAPASVSFLGMGKSSPAQHGG
jgi:hypothetical protein